MPNNGLIFEADALEYSLHGSASYTGSGAGYGVYSYEGTAATQYAVNTLLTQAGITLTVMSFDDGTTQGWEVSYDGPGAPFGGYVVAGSGFQSTSVAAVIRDLRIYSKLTGALYRVTWSGIDIYVNGGYSTTLAAGADLTSNGVGPNYIPVIGVPLSVEGTCSASRNGINEFVFDPCAPDEFPDQDYITHTTGAISGRMRFKQPGDSAWQALPVTFKVNEAPSGSGCPFGLSTGGIVTGSTTSNSQINLEQYTKVEFNYEGRTWVGTTRCRCSIEGTIYDYGEGTVTCYDECTEEEVPWSPHVYKTHTWGRSQGGSYTLIPNLERAVYRHAPGYKAMWYRGEFPEIQANASRSCVDGSVTVNEDDDEVVYPYLSPFLATVTDDIHPIEDCFPEVIYSPCTVSKSESENVSFDTSNWGLRDGPFGCMVTCPEFPPDCEAVAGGNVRPPLPTVNKIESVSSQFPSLVGDEAGGGQWHGVPLFRYHSTWPHPHWMLAHWFEDWDLSAVEYWKPVRQQWLYNAALPEAERPETRNFLIGSCVDESGHTPWMDAFIDELRWLGVSRFKSRTPDPIPDEKMIDEESPDRFSFKDDAGEDSTGSVSGSGITFDVDAVKCLIQLNDFVTAPYLYALICDKIRLSTSGWTNVASVSIKLQDHEGNEVQIGNTLGGEFDMIRGSSTKYAGSWAIDNGLSWVDDEGEDVDVVNGESIVTMNDPERLTTLGLLPGIGAEYIVIEIVPINPLIAAVVPFPELLRTEKIPVMYWESEKVAVLLFENGNMIRLGNWTFVTPAGFQNPPAISAAGIKSTIIDAICTQKLIYQALDPLDGLAAECENLFDDYEGNTIGITDKFSVSYPFPDEASRIVGRQALINTMAETPPLANFPFRKYDIEWNPTLDFCQVVWDWSQEERYLINAGARLDLYEGTTLISEGITSPEGWAISQHKHVVDNTETSNFKIQIGEEHYANVSPYRGFSALINVLPDGQVHLTRDDQSGILVATITSDDGVELVRFLKSGLFVRVLLTNESAISAQSAIRNDGKIISVVERDSGTEVWESWAYGLKPELVHMWTGLESPAIAICPESGMEYVAGWNSGSWKCYRKKTAGSAWALAGVIVSAAEAKYAGLEVSGEADGRIVFVVQIGADLKRYESFNHGDTWTENSP